ncbi:MAG: hypothetical protein R3D68_07135 [Hyphomicrobiaceae bacterium]
MDLVAKRTDHDRQLEVLRERMPRERPRALRRTRSSLPEVCPRHLFEHAATEEAERTGHDENTAIVGLRRPRAAIRHEIFQGLQARDEIDLIAHLHLPAHRAHVRIVEVRHHHRQGVAMDVAVGVDAEDEVALGMRDADVERLPFASVGLRQDTHGHAAHRGRRTLRLRQRVVGGAIIDDDDFEPGIIQLN